LNAKPAAKQSGDIKTAAEATSPAVVPNDLKVTDLKTAKTVQD